MTQIFQSIQSTMGRLQIFAPQSFETYNRFNWKRSLVIGYTAVFTICLGLCFIPSQEFAEYSKTLFIFLVGVLLLFIDVILCWYIPNIFELIGDFKSGIEMRQENPESKAIYKKSTESIEKYCSMLTFFVVTLNVNGVMAINLAFALFAYFTTGFDGYDYNFYFPIWFPFEKNLYEYAFEFVIEYLGMYCITCIAATAMGFLTASCLMIMSIVQDLRNELVSWSAIDMSNEDSMDIRERIFGFIRLHVHAIQCVSKVVDIYGLILTGYLMWSLVAICTSLLLVQTELSKDHPDYDVLCYVAAYTFYSFGIVFLYCEFGQQISNRFELLGDNVYQFNWYLLPADLQRTWNIIFMTAERKVQLVGFGNLIFNRQTFRQIVKSSFSFFVVFREFF